MEKSCKLAPTVSASAACCHFATGYLLTKCFFCLFFFPPRMLSSPLAFRCPWWTACSTRLMKLWKECVSRLVSSPDALFLPWTNPKLSPVRLAREGARVSIVVSLLSCFRHMYLIGTVGLPTLHRRMKGGKHPRFFLTNALVPNTPMSRGTIGSARQFEFGYCLLTATLSNTALT